MTEDFEAILQGGSEELAARTSALPAAMVRERGDELRRRHRMATAALAVALVAAVGGGAFAVTGHSRQAPPPEAVVSPTTPATFTAPPTVTPKPPSAAPDGPAATSPSSPPSPPCRSLVVPQGVKDAVTLAYRRSQPGLVHIAPVKGTFYYGECDGVFYAGTSFTPTADATENELVQLQDEGGAEKYFTKAKGSAWTFVAGDGLPRDPGGCAAIREIPARLAALWGDCLARP
ncbi:hypothetical protein FE633_20430 [Streptomyces montanus]|uniref:Uncharacterized protein n=1 Tax=Streptomyces montanus TaxID=2580423 RepID=A0A5R9FRA2_9ACTN|nr:hypothetical protein [Streptomyces montanus]TLS44390.1 hypothetical protein FE633_20430 [Streptomyces montanus]